MLERKNMAAEIQATGSRKTARRAWPWLPPESSFWSGFVGVGFSPRRRSLATLRSRLVK